MSTDSDASQSDAARSDAARSDAQSQNGPDDPAGVLEAQRRESAPGNDAGASDERPDDGIAPIVNNTGDDGGAASG